MTRDLNTLNLAWLTRLRWAAIAGQLTTIIAAERLLGVAVPWPPLLAVLGAEVALNLFGHGWLRARQPIGEAVIGGAVVADLLALTLLLYFTGGPTNPFNFLYLVHIALAAVVLSPRWTWGLAGLSAALFALLFVASEPLRMLADADATMVHGMHDMHGMHGGSDAAMDVHTRGMWVAFTVAAVFIVYFTSRITRELVERERELRETRDRAARTERLAALATLAAGAAHELSTPLSTIAVLSRELERELASQDCAPSADSVEDTRLIQAEVARCRAVLDRLAGDAGRPRGEAVVRISAAALVDATVAGTGVTAALDEDTRAAFVAVRKVALSQSLRGLVTNAILAAGVDDVEVAATRRGDELRLVIADRGPGMAPELLARIGEPFFTTREPGRGMGLGVFLARSVVAEHGGRLELDSTVGEGTRAVVYLPLVSDADTEGDGHD